MDYAPRNEVFSLGKNTNLSLSSSQLGGIIKSIERTSSAKIRCSTRGGTRNFMIHGFPKAIERAKELLEEETSKPTKLDFEIPARVRYYVVGNKGYMVKEIAKKHDVSIWVGKEKFDLMPDRLEKPEVPKVDTPYVTFVDDGADIVIDRYPKMVSVTIKGRPENCEEAEEEILKIVDCSIDTKGVVIAIPHGLYAFTRHIQSKIFQLHANADLHLDFSSDKRIALSGSKYRFDEYYNDLKAIVAQVQRKVRVCDITVPDWMIRHMPFGTNPYYTFSSDDKIFARYSRESSTLTIVSDKEETMLRAKQRVEEKLAEYRSVSIDLNDFDHLYDIEKDLDVKFHLPWYRSDEIDDQILEVVGKSEISLEHAINKLKEIIIPRDQVVVIDDIDIMLQPQAETILMKVLGDRLEFVSLDDFFYIMCFSPSDKHRLTPANNSLNELRTLQQTSYKGVVLPFPSSDQKYLTTPSNFLSSIYDGVEETISNPQYPFPRIELYSNGKDTLNDELYVFGKSHEVDRVASNINHLRKDLESFKKVGFFTKTIKVPSCYLTALIGTKRKCFKEIKEKFKVGIQIHDVGEFNRSSSNFPDESMETPLTLAGIKHNVLATENYLSDKLNKLRNEKLEAFSVTDDSTYHIQAEIYNTTPFEIRILERLLDVKVWFYCPGRYYPRPTTADEINIVGSPEAIAEAKRQLMTIYKI
ncbi:hypothetical protein CXQ85_001542 [Candidozyma haemuli]|uniref:K Homology domain-containing protein n=1 Tax=Candidozyma haemuli TaxID=45357 RepID=A0A2V1AQK0_9ASCO|nr:hypothetical protein CXQ85_001542 [[Candida] haemuloni]PVH19241.1 hypothetical protein CXQ85_001542 [[Candida] haemuloni]